MTGMLYFGLLYAVEHFSRERNYEIEYLDDFSADEFSVKEAEEFIKTLAIPAKYTPRDYQKEAFIHAIRDRRVLFLSPTASGKSLIIYLIIRYYQHVDNGEAKFLIIVPNTNLVSQLTGDFADYGMCVSGLVHGITGGVVKQTDCLVTISTWQSIYRMDKEYFKQFKVVIGDEAHLFQAKSLIAILTKCEQGTYRFGFTGTLDGSKTHKLVLEGNFGPVRKVITTSELIRDKHLSDFNIKGIVLRHSEVACKHVAKQCRTYPEEINYIVTKTERNQFIRNLALSLKGNTLILFQYVDKHGKALYDLIASSVSDDRKVFYVSGDVQAEERNIIRRAVENETDCIVVASLVFATGINIVNLRNIIFSSPSKSRVRVLQSIGRVLRRSSTSTTAELFDIADDLSWKGRKNYTLLHFIERIKIYKQEKFQYKNYVVKLKDRND